MRCFSIGGILLQQPVVEFQPGRLRIRKVQKEHPAGFFQFLSVNRLQRKHAASNPVVYAQMFYFGPVPGWQNQHVDTVAPG